LVPHVLHAQGKTLVAQHKMVKGAIAEEIKSIHGLTVTTKVATKAD
jgi:stress-induced morphogen